MEQILEFPALLRLIDERAAAFRAVLDAAPSLDVPVPTCPEWTLIDLARHLGNGEHRWAAIVAAGPADGPPAESDSLDPPTERAALADWAAESTASLISALREAGPVRDCWTWWDGSQSPQHSGAVARHRLQEVAVHTYDAQLAVGAAEPLLAEVALDGVDEFLTTCCAGPSPWPHEPCAVDYHATEGRSWRLTLDVDGARVARLPEGAAPADASLLGTAGELVLALYGRIPVDSLKVDGDRRIFDQLLAWEPE